MSGPSPFARVEMTQRDNSIAAISKASTAPLDRLNAQLIESIAASHARRGSKAFVELHAKLVEIVEARHEREREVRHVG